MKTWADLGDCGSEHANMVASSVHPYDTDAIDTAIEGPVALRSDVDYGHPSQFESHPKPVEGS